MLKVPERTTKNCGPQNRYVEVWKLAKRTVLIYLGHFLKKRKQKLWV